MTTSSETPAPAIRVAEPESMLSVILRRCKYAVAVGAVVLLFVMAGGWLLPGLATYPGITPPGTLAFGLGQGIMALITLGLLVALSAIFCVLVTHPDTPHTGIFCAFLGLIALAVKAGTVGFPMHLTYQTVFPEGAAMFGGSKVLLTRFAMESLFYAVVVGIVNFVGTYVHQTFFKNAAWLHRLGSSRETPLALSSDETLRSPVVDAALESPRKAQGEDYWVATIGALFVTGVVAAILLVLLLRNDTKGQALFACFTAFACGGFAAQQIFPKTPAWCVWMAAPLVGAVAYVVAIYLMGTSGPVFPGHTPLPPVRALPLDYLSAGVPGAVLGYYSSLKWQIHQVVHES